jgi:potassium-transporting ATPase KdpC subunit
MKKQIIMSLKVILLFTILLGVMYPFFITGIGQLFFPLKSNGSLIQSSGKTIGSELIGQEFKSNKFFHGRPSFSNYNPLPSGASNFSLNNKKLIEMTEINRNYFDSINENHSKIPIELLYNSGSGLDPHISPEGAKLQAKRIARERDLDIRLVYQIINTHIEKKQFNILGEERVNVLLLNIDLEKLDNKHEN